MLKNTLKPIRTWSTSTYKLCTPEYIIITQQQWCRAKETDVDEQNLLPSYL